LIYDGQEQADFYQAVFETFWDQPWFMDLPGGPGRRSVLLPGCSETGEFRNLLQTAEEVVRQWYVKDRPFDFHP